MKSKVIIEDGLTKIILTPENDFEIDILVKGSGEHYQKYILESEIKYKRDVYAFSEKKDFYLDIRIIKVDNKQR